jgi:hypothetical protein
MQDAFASRTEGLSQFVLMTYRVVLVLFMVDFALLATTKLNPMHFEAVAITVVVFIATAVEVGFITRRKHLAAALEASTVAVSSSSGASGSWMGGGAVAVASGAATAAAVLSVTGGGGGGDGGGGGGGGGGGASKDPNSGAYVKMPSARDAQVGWSVV